MMQTIDDKEAMFGKLKDEFAAIVTSVDQAAGRDQIADVEQAVFRQLQHLGRSLLEAYVAQSGTGYKAGHPPQTEEGTVLTFKGIVESPYFSIFGEVTIRRAAYAREGAHYVYPLDAQLNLPESKFSYLLQQWMLARATETDFREAVAVLNEMLEGDFYPSLPQRLCADVAPTVPTFCAQLEAPAPATEGTHLAISADGKGVPLVKAERPAQATDDPPKARRGKGEKPGIKKEAVVTVDFSFTPGPREPDELVKALLHEYTAADRQQAKRERQQRQQAGVSEPRVACNAHRRATLDGKDDAMTYLMERIDKRDPSGTKRIIALLDGDPYLENALHRALSTSPLTDRVDAVILDILHVSDYLWEAGTALHGETGPQRVAWVRGHLRALLQSQGGHVIEELQQTLTTTSLRPSQQTALQKAITYCDNHRHMMDYATYLARGYPIATGLVEGTCRSLVKDRMEQSGMRWTIPGAQAVLHLRAVRKNNDWDAFWKFHIASEKTRLYPESDTVSPDSYKKAA